MGSHCCKYCEKSGQTNNRFRPSSSGDVTMVFDSGRTWTMPDMVLHNVADHDWLPPNEFVWDVMNAELVGGYRLQTKGPSNHMVIGYLEGPFPTGNVPNGFVEKLEKLLKEADEMGMRRQTRGEQENWYL